MLSISSPASRPKPSTRSPSSSKPPCMYLRKKNDDGNRREAGETCLSALDQRDGAVDDLHHAAEDKDAAQASLELSNGK